MSANPKVIVKKNLIIFCSPAHWESIWEKILADNSASIVVSWVLKRELGFTVRTDTNYNESTYKMITTVYLDFFDEPSETMFRLRYL